MLAESSQGVSRRDRDLRGSGCGQTHPSPDRNPSHTSTVTVTARRRRGYDCDYVTTSLAPPARGPGQRDRTVTGAVTD